MPGSKRASITYLEAHGSGTPVGDPVEIRALIFKPFSLASHAAALRIIARYRFVSKIQLG